MIDPSAKDFENIRAALLGRRLSRISGTVTGQTGLLTHALLPEAFMGEICEIHARDGGRLPAEVVGFRHGESLLMPLGEVRNIGLNAEVTTTGKYLEVPVGIALLGRQLDGLGHPIDGKPLRGVEKYVPVYKDSPDPIDRKRIRTQMPLGIKAIDAMFPCGEGQRVGIFAAAGGGKSTLMGMIARFAEAEVKVIVLVGERGREVREFIEDSLGEEGLEKSVVVVATADKPAVVRMKAAYTGTTIAEYFRDQGKKVILMMDSVTRFARAQREIGLARGEPPARYGFPPSVFAEMPKLFERCGNTGGTGSMTGFYTVLVEGDNLDEPVADETKSLLDGHIILSPKVLPRRPSIDLLLSESRVKGSLRICGDNKARDKEVREATKTVDSFLRFYNEEKTKMEFGGIDEPTKDMRKKDKAWVERVMNQNSADRLVPLETTHKLVVDLSKAIRTRPPENALPVETPEQLLDALSKAPR